MAETVRFPVDFDAVHKGDVIGRKRLAEILGERPGTLAYRSKLVGFAQALQAQLWQRGKPFTIRCRKDEVTILTDVEAAEFNRIYFRKRCRGLLKTHLQNCAVETSSLNPCQLRTHDRALAIQARSIVALNEIRAIRPIVYRRMTAMLPMG